MVDEIVKFLQETTPWKKSDKKVREMIADHFNGTIVGRYVKIDGKEYFIKINPDEASCGYDIREMDWGGVVNA